MEERLAAERARAEAEERDAEAAERIRVTDRRRITLDESGAGVRERTEGSGEDVSAPSLKPSYVEELEARTRAAEQKAADVQARFEQVRAELQRETDEMRQRLARTNEERAARERAAFVAALLPVIDNLQRAIEAAEAGGSKEALVEGLRGTVSGFESTLASVGAEAIEAVGEPFDPELHEAVSVIEVEPERDGQVTAQYSRGYRMGRQLLRPARVQVGRSSGRRAEGVGGLE
ncbi:MAG TPA: nucleotide exchange factor GrpE [Pyrinomonadaceae bacterium]|nr:nucleotide exchange factor GrpE [Pyrinomonadaceae bacterium]